MNARSEVEPSKNRVLILGGGNMGAAFAKAFLTSHKLAKRDLTIIEIDSSKAKKLKAELSCKVLNQIPKDFSEYKLIVLAFKPQQLKEVAPQIVNKLRPRQIVVSILAGMTLQILRQALQQHKQIVCCMPNLPVQVGLGVTVIYSDKLTKKSNLEFVKNLLSSAGAVLQVRRPELLDAATALTASGCGFIFYLVEGFLRAAIDLGYSNQQANLLVTQTFAGTIKLWSSSQLAAEEWRAKVTSKGGTTQAGISIFDSNNLQQHLIDGIKRAYQRCQELRAAQ